FFQAEDGIRDKLVTGVQTCALPIYQRQVASRLEPKNAARRGAHTLLKLGHMDRLEAVGRRRGNGPSPRLGIVLILCEEQDVCFRSEERRVGKEWRAGGWARRVEERE